ncbi:hypothetical protein CDL12_13525 [Handroanthus impetiginosus]|uniref:Uncharacterized protein n=1 Tax=Handroanthus impetiginosus TaxID=429701 RepID=A0A2G9H8Q3_9LAMI|nr:hypothetical protein CDL12_13525 [Handroanthus impetiginosus]
MLSESIIPKFSTVRETKSKLHSLHCLNYLNPELWTYQYGILQNNQSIYDYSDPTQYSGIPRSSYDSRSFSEAGKREEVEAVDELLQILVECLKEADMRTREVLLRKFFLEIEKETSLEEFLVERINKSKIRLLLSGDVCDQRGREISLSEKQKADGLSGDGSSKKMERFKVKTVQVGEVVKEEPK